MKYHTAPAIVALLASLFTGCSRHTPATAGPKFTDLGVIEVSDGMPSRHALTDGQACILTPTILKDGRIKLVTSIRGTNASGAILTSSLAFDASADQAMIFALDKSNVIGLTLHISKQP